MTDDEIRAMRDKAAGALFCDYGFNGDVVTLGDEALRAPAEAKALRGILNDLADEDCRLTAAIRHRIFAQVDA